MVSGLDRWELTKNEQEDISECNSRLLKTSSLTLDKHIKRVQDPALLVVFLPQSVRFRPT